MLALYQESYTLLIKYSFLNLAIYDFIAVGNINRFIEH